MMLTLAALLVAHFIAAFVTLDLIFRRIPVDPDRLQSGLKFWGRIYFGTAALFTIVGAWVVWQTGAAPLAAILPSPIPWWLLWRFGVAKQFLFLNWPENERSSHVKKPDP